MLQHLFQVLFACVFPTHCLLSFWCYHSPVWAGCSRVSPVEDGLLRLCEAEYPVLPPLGEELCPDHPLPRKKEHVMTKTNCRYIVSEKMYEQFAPPLWPNLLTLA